jgi:hypothetical protein
MVESDVGSYFYFLQSEPTAQLYNLVSALLNVADILSLVSHEIVGVLLKALSKAW